MKIGGAKVCNLTGLLEQTPRYSKEIWQEKKLFKVVYSKISLGSHRGQIFGQGLKYLSCDISLLGVFSRLYRSMTLWELGWAGRIFYG